LCFISVGVSTVLLLLLFCLFFLQKVHERRRIARIRKKYFQQNGGRLLLDEMKNNHGIAFTIFTEEELKEATNNFDKANMLGQGGNGAVYKGNLRSNEEVAIKKCKTINERNKKEFVKEMLILSQINHINIVRILGCCLELEIPILVYEFIPNGTLFHLLHSNSTYRISLTTRLRIAQEAAEALAYLHSWASPPIVHCDVKSANILLDQNYVAKVSDFGASALAPSDDQFITLVQGTRGYLDPQSIQTGQLTVKSDVYSFGVVLVELLARKKAFSLEGHEERSLASAFLSAMKESRLEEVFDVQILDERSTNVIRAVAELARECLNMDGEMRPEMREVAEQLDKFRKATMHPWRLDDHDEAETLPCQPSNTQELEMTTYYSLEETEQMITET
jgi:serine/threonine protein kinase